MLGDERFEPTFDWFWQRVVSGALVGKLGMAANRRNRSSIEQRRSRRYPFERIVGMPHPGAQLETPPPAFLAPDLVAEIEIGNVGDFLADAQRRVLAMNPNRYIKRAEMAREVEMLILRKTLVGEDQHRVFCKRVFDRKVIGWLDLLRQIDIADLSGKTRRDGKNADAHKSPPPRGAVDWTTSHRSMQSACVLRPRLDSSDGRNAKWRIAPATHSLVTA